MYSACVYHLGKEPGPVVSESSLSSLFSCTFWYFMPSSPSSSSSDTAKLYTLQRIRLAAASRAFYMLSCCLLYFRTVASVTHCTRRHRWLSLRRLFGYHNNNTAQIEIKYEKNSKATWRPCNKTSVSVCVRTRCHRVARKKKKKNTNAKKLRQRVNKTRDRGFVLWGWWIYVECTK